MKFYCCVLEVEAYEKGSVFGKNFKPGDIHICSRVLTADSFFHAYDLVCDMCSEIDFADSIIISLGRIYHE